MEYFGAIKSRYYPTTNNMTLEAGRTYRALANHTLNFPTMTDGQWIEITPDNGDWVASNLTFVYPGTAPAAVFASTGPAIWIADGSGNLRVHTSESAGVRHFITTGPSVGGTSWAVTHPFATTDIHSVQLKNLTTNQMVIPDATITDANTVTIAFSPAATANNFRVFIHA